MGGKTKRIWRVGLHPGELYSTIVLPVVLYLSTQVYSYSSTSHNLKSVYGSTVGSPVQWCASNFTSSRVLLLYYSSMVGICPLLKRKKRILQYTVCMSYEYHNIVLPLQYNVLRRTTRPNKWSYVQIGPNVLVLQYNCTVL